MTVNGKITRDVDPDVTHWTSKEDQSLFSDLKKQYGVILMGSHTYSENRRRIRLSPGILRVVLTKNPDAYTDASVAGQLEFSAEEPPQLVDSLKKRGYTKAMLAGGAQMNSSFLSAGLVDELRLTVEPTLFGTGKDLVARTGFIAELKLTDIKKLNSRGTLHLTYAVIKHV